MVLLGWKAAICGTAFSSEDTALRVLVALGRGHVRDNRCSSRAGVVVQTANVMLGGGSCVLELKK